MPISTCINKSKIMTFVKVMSPIARPMGRLLDRTVGKDVPDIYSTDELVKILEEHERSDDSDIEADEIAIVRNAAKGSTDQDSVEASETFNFGATA
jgi:hypothetical protein